jgi:hypothetical protein
MRISLGILSFPLLSLAACGGGGVNTIGSISPPSDPTPGKTFLDVSAPATFNVAGGLQSLAIDADTKAQLYQGNASTTSTPSGTVNYDPRDGIFTLVLSDSAAGVSQNVRYQDPAHRTDFQALEVPDYAGYNYLTSGQSDGTTVTNDTFFYQRPGTTTSYVTLAGFVHTDVQVDPNDATKAVVTLNERGAMAFGSPTPILQIPTSGGGHYAGDFLATMVDGSTFSWLNGTSAIDVDFAKASVGLSLDGVVGPGFASGQPGTSALSGATFNATGSAALNSSSGAFSGQFSSAFFTQGGAKIPVDFTSVNPATNVAGGSSVDGAFYGPGATEIGGNFRIVGGVPGERVDVLGAFTGAKK